MSEPIDTTTLLAVNKAANDWLEETRQGQKKAMPNYSPIPDEPVQMSLIMVEAVIRALNVTKTHTLSQRKWAATSSKLLEVLKSTLAALEDASSVVDAGPDEEYAYQGEIESARALIEEIKNTPTP